MSQAKCLRNTTVAAISAAQKIFSAVSCFVLHPEFIAISTSGAAANPAWLQNFISKGCKIYCGFDSDRTGNMLADKTIKLYPSIKRLHPSKHDWNEVLQNYHP